MHSNNFLGSKVVTLINHRSSDLRASPISTDDEIELISSFVVSVTNCDCRILEVNICNLRSHFYIDIRCHFFLNGLECPHYFKMAAHQTRSLLNKYPFTINILHSFENIEVLFHYMQAFKALDSFHSFGSNVDWVHEVSMKIRLICLVFVVIE